MGRKAGGGVVGAVLGHAAILRAAPRLLRTEAIDCMFIQLLEKAPRMNSPIEHLLKQAGDRAEQLGYSRRSRQAYLSWIRRYIAWAGGGHPAALAVQRAQTFLRQAALEHGLAPGTQRQARSALRFLYQEVLGLDWPSTGGHPAGGSIPASPPTAYRRRAAHDDDPFSGEDDDDPLDPGQGGPWRVREPVPAYGPPPPAGRRPAHHRGPKVPRIAGA